MSSMTLIFIPEAKPQLNIWYLFLLHMES